MIKLNKLLHLVVGVTCSLSVFASNTQPATCKKSQVPIEIKQQIRQLDEAFQWDNSSCKVVATTSIFPKKDKNDEIKYEKGFQVFVYQNDKLKFICLPGWICKRW